MPASLRIDADLLWAGRGRELTGGSVAVEAGEIVYLGPRRAAPAAEQARSVPFLAPGFFDRHVHVGLGDPEAMLAGGLTRVRDLAWPLPTIEPLARRSRRPDFGGPEIEFCGPMLTAPGGYPTDRSWAPAGTGEEVVGATAARAAVGRVLEAGAVAVKVALNTNADGLLGDPELIAICAAASARGRSVVAHVEGPGQVERALAAGVDELAHTPWTEALDDALIADLARRCRIVSTLDMHLGSDDPSSFELALDNLSRFHAAGGQVVYGTDLGNGPSPPGIRIGELRHLARAGLSPAELLDACTAGPLAPGGAADLVGLRADPRDRLDAYDQIALVVRAGVVGVDSPGRS